MSTSKISPSLLLVASSGQLHMAATGLINFDTGNPELASRLISVGSTLHSAGNELSSIANELKKTEAIEEPPASPLRRRDAMDEASGKKARDMLDAAWNARGAVEKDIARVEGAMPTKGTLAGCMGAGRNACFALLKAIQGGTYDAQIREGKSV